MVGAFGLGAGVVGTTALAKRDKGTAVQAALATRLPKTKISSVDCSKLPGLCEVVAGQTLFYTDPEARYLVIGRVYDMAARTDLTATRLLELNPDTLLAGAAQNSAEERPQAAASSQIPVRVPLADLPKAGAIRWGKPGGARLVVFSDFRCGYCRQLSEELARLDVAVEERPISVLGSRSLTEAVYCARDPVKALHAAYRGDEPSIGARCDTSGLDANEAFARKHGFSGTPIIVRADGEVLRGYRPAPVLAAFAAGKPAA
jgi:thiol:disulfide interchange protein DsbC